MKRIKKITLEFEFLRWKNKFMPTFRILSAGDFNLNEKLMFISGTTDLVVDLPGSKVLSALLLGRMFILDLPVAWMMPWR